MKIIWLTQGQFTLVDDEDYRYLSEYNWHTHKDRDRFYARTTIVDNGHPKKVMMHRYIMRVSGGMVLDHKDGNGLNNQKSNLRICTRAENGRNQKIKDGLSSQFKGVHFHKDTGKWMSRVTVSKKLIYLGLFVSETDAAVAYDNKAKELHGEFAKLNFS